MTFAALIYYWPVKDADASGIRDCFGSERVPKQSVHDYVFMEMRPRDKLLLFLEDSLSCEDLAVIKDAAQSVNFFKRHRFQTEDFSEYRPLDLSNYVLYSTDQGLSEAKQKRLPPYETASGYKAEYLVVVRPWGTRGWKITSKTEISVLQEYGRTKAGKITYFERMRFKKLKGKWLFDGFELTDNFPGELK